MTNNISGSNYNNSQYSNTSRGYNGYNSYSSVPRGWLIFAQISGTIVSVIGLAIFIHFMQNIYNSLPSDNLTKQSVVALILSVIVYFVWRSIYTAIVIVRLARKSSDEQLCANRYIISALSLGIGGFFTPFLVTGFPNVATTSTIKPRYFLSKTMGLCISIGAPILAFAYFLTLLSGRYAVANTKLIFDTSSTMGIISIVVLTVSLLALAFGILTTTLFSNKRENEFVNNSPSTLLKVISTIWMAILTVELILVIVMSIVRLISALLDLFRTGEQGGGAIMMLFALMNLLITMSYVGMVIYVTTRTIAGLWSIDGNIKIGKYRHNNYAQSRLYNGNMNA